MRWCVNNCICRFLYRRLPAVVLVLVLLLSANQVIHFARDKGSPICYKIVSPFASKPGGGVGIVGVTRSSGAGFLRRNGGAGDNETETDYILPNVEWTQARYDERRMLRIYEWVWQGALWSSLMTNYNVCLATQGSIDRIPSIGEVSEKWLGPISLAVYVRNGDELWVGWILSIFISYMRRCSALFLRTVSVHVVVPAEFEPPDYTNQSFYYDVMNDEHPCGQPHQFMTSLMIKFLLHEPIGLYPQNHLRNIARKNCPSPWVLMTDVDIIPRLNSSSMINSFYNGISARKCQKCAFVIPVFELDKSMPYPSTKKELVAYANKGLARQFHLKIYKFGHWATNYTAWLSTNLDEEATKISHTVDNKVNHYEPFYVSSDDIPKHDERFVGYGFTRSSQVLEARVMGWKFFVLTPLFAIHWGLQTPQTIRSPSFPIPFHSAIKSNTKAINQAKSSRRNQNLRNHVIYTDFVSELMAKYNISVSRRKSQRKQIYQPQG